MVQFERAMVTIIGGIGSLLRAIRIYVVTANRIIGINAIILHTNSQKIMSSQGMG